MNIEHNIKMFTKYVNRFLKDSRQIEDWSFEITHDDVTLQVNSIKEYHISERVSNYLFADIPMSEIKGFALDLCMSIIRKLNREGDK